jgi:LPS export ABC transporter protein LptC
MIHLPERVTRAFPLILLTLLAALALTLDRMTELPYFSPGAVQHDPDLVVLNFTATEYSPDGGTHYRLNASRMRHYPDDHSELDHAVLKRTEKAAAPLTVTSEKALLTDGSKQIWFESNVLLQSEGNGKAPPMTVQTSRLQMNTESGETHSEAPSVAESNGSILHTVGFDYDHRQGLMKLHSKVSIDYAPPKR